MGFFRNPLNSIKVIQPSILRIPSTLPPINGFFGVHIVISLKKYSSRFILSSNFNLQCLITSSSPVDFPKLFLGGLF
jgi:L-cysteine desulfidase